MEKTKYTVELKAVAVAEKFMFIEAAAAGDLRHWGGGALFWIKQEEKLAHLVGSNRCQENQANYNISAVLKSTGLIASEVTHGPSCHPQ